MFLHKSRRTSSAPELLTVVLMHHDHVLMIEVSAVLVAIATTAVLLAIVATIVTAFVVLVMLAAFGKCRSGYEKGCQQEHQSASTPHKDLLVIG
jgi:hypothetical protein